MLERRASGAIDREGRLLVAFCAAAVALWLVLGIANLYLGDLNQDEGWYLYAGRQVARGWVPYWDFAFTQGPVMAYVYAAAYPIVKRCGVAGGRAVTLGFAGLTLGIAGWLAARLAPTTWRRVSVAVALALLGGNVYQSYFTTVVKTYALSGLFLLTGLAALARAREGSRIGPFLGAGVALVMAAGTRISAAAALLVVFIYLGVMRRKWGWRPAVAFGAGVLGSAAVVFAPFLLIAPEGFLFGMLKYHAARLAGSGLAALIYKAGFVSRVIQAYSVALGLAAALVFLRLAVPYAGVDTGGGMRTPPGLPGVLWAVVAGVTLVHLSAPFPYDDYQAMVYPVYAVALAGAAARRLAALLPGEGEATARWRVWLGGTTLALCTLSSFSSPVNQDWFVRGRDRIWWMLKERPALQVLQEVGRRLRGELKPEDELLTQDIYVAVEADRAVPRGLEMGPFSYFPDWPSERARAMRVLNREMMVELLSRTRAPRAAFSGYGLAVRAPEITPVSEGDRRALWEIVTNRYEEVAVVPHFGQAHTALRIMALKPEAESARE